MHAYTAWGKAFVCADLQARVLYSALFFNFLCLCTEIMERYYI